jgi:hypothetical protein
MREEEDVGIGKELKSCLELDFRDNHTTLRGISFIGVPLRPPNLISAIQSRINFDHSDLPSKTLARTFLVAQLVALPPSLSVGEVNKIKTISPPYRHPKFKSQKFCKEYKKKI